MKRLIADLSKKGLTKQTIHNILTPLKEAYHHAMDNGIIGSNPVAQTGRLTRSKQDRRAHIQPLTSTDVIAPLRTAGDADSAHLFPLIMCAARPVCGKAN